jgi:hydroxymethylglutaryl-CoA lyase
MSIKIIECPRDAMQGIDNFIGTEVKAAYINQLLKVGFDTIDFGSFVSSKAIPQMRDTAEVVKKLDLSSSETKLLAIVANLRGATEALEYSEIANLGFPLSISDTFQRKNTNTSISDALAMLAEMQEACLKAGRNLVTYLSMGFGNPYNDPYNEQIVSQFVEILVTLGIKTISIADTIGVAKPEQVNNLLSVLIRQYPAIEFGVHLHSNPATAAAKINAAVDAGCERFDGAILGFGGCPMAGDELVGNINTGTILEVMAARNIPLPVKTSAFTQAEQMAVGVFN